MERQEGEEIPSFTESVQKLLNAGAYAVQGARATMEDVHKLILWSEMKEQKIEEITLQSSLDSDISFRPSKRNKPQKHLFSWFVMVMEVKKLLNMF